MRAQGLKRQTYKTGGTLRRMLLCVTVCAAVWLLSGQVRAHFNVPLLFSITPKEEKTPDATEKKESEYQTRETALSGRTWYALQLGAFTQENAAWQLSQEFIPRGAAGYVCRENDVFRVYAAAYPTRTEAQSVQTRLNEQGVTTYIQVCSEPNVTLRAGGSEAQVAAVCEAVSYLDALSGKFYALSMALDGHEMTESEAFDALRSECATCLALAEKIKDAFAGEVDAAALPLHELLSALAQEGESVLNNMSAARIGAALKRCQLTAAVGLKNFAAFLASAP